MILDFFISITVVNRFLMRCFRPDFDYRWTKKKTQCNGQW